MTIENKTLKDYLNEIQSVVAENLLQVDASIIASISNCWPKSIIANTGKNKSKDFVEDYSKINEIFNLKLLVDVPQIDNLNDRTNQGDTPNLNQTESLITIVTQHIAKAGGKRLRPLLALVTGIIFDTQQNSILLATAVEMIHTATLLHDDVIDKSKIRRGMPSAHTIWGEKAIILVGDYLFSQSFNLMLQTESLKALNSLAKASAIIASAEVRQLEMIGDYQISFEQYLGLIEAKTATLFAAACESVALASGAEDELAGFIENFGLNLGICFQIIDDLLDYCGKSQKKDIFQDIKEGKMTLPLMLLLSCCSEAESKILMQVYQGDVLTGEIENQLKQLMIIYKIEVSVRQIAEIYAAKALESLDQLQIRLAPKKELILKLIQSLRYFTLALVQRQE
mgnify:CR=1 FL=1